MANTADTTAAGKIIEVTFTGTGADWNHSTDGGFADMMHVKSIIWHPSGADDILVINEGGVDGPSIVHWKAYTDLVSNGGFASDTTGWAGTDCTIASVAGGQSGNCLEITRTGGTTQYAAQTKAGFIIGKTYKLATFVESGTSGNEAFSVTINNDGWVGLLSGTSSGTWVSSSEIFTAAATSITYALTKSTATAGTMLFDTVTVNDLPTDKQISFGEKGVPLKPYIDIDDCTFSDITTTKIIFILE